VQLDCDLSLRVVDNFYLIGLILGFVFHSLPKIVGIGEVRLPDLIFSVYLRLDQVSFLQIVRFLNKSKHRHLAVIV